MNNGMAMTQGDGVCLRIVGEFSLLTETVRQGSVRNRILDI